jgi:uncharacterized membrane protein YqjE
MASPYDPRDARRVNGVGPIEGSEPSLGDLFRRLTTDTSELVRQEVALAKTELREAGGTLARDGTRIGIAVGLALAGSLALTAFLILLLGGALDNYWLSALIVGVVFLGIGVVLAKNAVADVKRRGLTPRETVGTLKEDAAWAKQEARQVKRELTT